MRAFQQQGLLPLSGVCDLTTWTALVEAGFELGERLLCLQRPMLRGDDVADLQLRLSHLGFDPGRIDGIFGQQTERAVSSFQRNTGLVCDRVCGDDTVAALEQLGRGGELTSVTVVREAERLRSGRRELEHLTVALGSDGSALATLITEDVRSILDQAEVQVSVLQGDWSAQASYCNDLGADLYLGIEITPAIELDAAHFGVDGFDSLGGRRLAEAVIHELPAIPGWGSGSVSRQRTPVLRETRVPAVVLRLGDPVLVEPQHGMIATAIIRALYQWPQLVGARQG